MSIRLTCLSCGAKLVAPDTARGKRAKCTKCGQVLTLESGGQQGTSTQVKPLLSSQTPVPPSPGAMPPPRRPADPPAARQNTPHELRARIPGELVRGFLRFEKYLRREGLGILVLALGLAILAASAELQEGNLGRALWFSLAFFVAGCATFVAPRFRYEVSVVLALIPAAVLLFFVFAGMFLSARQPHWLAYFVFLGGICLHLFWLVGKVPYAKSIHRGLARGDYSYDELRRAREHAFGIRRDPRGRMMRMQIPGSYVALGIISILYICSVIVAISRL